LAIVLSGLVRAQLERVIAERPKISRAIHYNCASTAQFSVLELTNIYARHRETDVRGIRTIYGFDLEHANPRTIADPARAELLKTRKAVIAAWNAVAAKLDG
jgi:hypothetical protein